MKRRRGDGTVTKRKDGRWEAAAYVNTPNGKRRVRRYATTRTEAEGILVSLRRKDSNGILTNTKERKLGDYLDYWLAITKNNVKHGSWVSYEVTVRIYLKPGLGQKILTKLRPRDIQLFFDNQIRTGVSARSIQKQKTALSAALKLAEQEELLERNVARLVKIPQYNPKAVEPWNVNQLGTFLDYAAQDSLSPVFEIISLYGLRISEVLGLSWHDIDYVKKVIHVRHQLEIYDGKFDYAEVKTDAGRRDLPLTERVKAILANISRSNDGPLPDLIFKTQNHTPFHRRNVLRSFHRISNKAGLPKSKIHNLRHAAATMYKDIGASPIDAQRLLGHANVTTTQQIYQHSNIENSFAIIGRYEQKLAAVRASSRQIQPSNKKEIAEIVSYNSGSGEWFRPADPRLMSPAL